MDNARIELNMIHNGLDFVLKSMETIHKSDEDLKYSILNLHAGIQLILKEILFNEHWSLIFQNVDHAERDKIQNGDFISVNSDTLIQRLKKIRGLDIPKQFIEKLEWLRKERNKIEHFKLAISVDTMKANVAQLLSHFMPFMKKEIIDKRLLSSDDKLYSNLKEYLNEFDIYVKEKISRIYEYITNVKIVLYCPNCFQETVEFIDETNAFCHYCEIDIPDFPNSYIQSFIDDFNSMDDGPDTQVFECPQCEHDTFIEYKKDYLCLTCGVLLSSSEIVGCEGPVCNGNVFVYRRHDDVHFCRYCIEYFTSK